MNSKPASVKETSPDQNRLVADLEPVIQALKQQLGADLISVVLFGSRARGDHQPASDWDLLVIAHKLPERVFPRHLYLQAMLPETWAGRVSLLAKTPAEFEAGLPALYLDIALDGIIIFDPDQYMTRRLTQLRQLIQTEGLHREQRGRDLIWQWQEFPGPGRQLTWDGLS